MNSVEQFIHDLGQHEQPPHLSEDKLLVVLPWRYDPGRKVAVEVAQLDGSKGGPWPAVPPSRVCFSAGAEPSQPREISTLGLKEEGTPNRHWDRYPIDLSGVWAEADERRRPDMFLKIVMQIRGEIP